MACDKWIRIAAEYGGAWLWDKDGVNHDEDDLPITEGLRAALNGWCGWYGHDSDDNVPSEHVLDTIAHAAVGAILAEAVKRALPGWTVIYGWLGRKI